MRLILTGMVLSAALLMGACSGSEPDAPAPEVDLPEPPPGLEQLADDDLDDMVSTMVLALSQNSGTPVTSETVLDVTDGELEDVIAHYDDALTADGWQESTGLLDVSEPLGMGWERDGQRVVLVSLPELAGRDLAILLVPAEVQS